MPAMHKLQRVAKVEILMVEPPIGEYSIHLAPKSKKQTADRHQTNKIQNGGGSTLKKKPPVEKP